MYLFGKLTTTYLQFPLDYADPNNQNYSFMSFMVSHSFDGSVFFFKVDFRMCTFVTC